MVAACADGADGVGSGMTIAIVVPLPGAVSQAMDAPIFRARSRMPMQPK
jgi:hypothetical protein